MRTKTNDAKDGSMKADVAVVGAGFAGLGLAYHLRESGLDVLLLDRREVGEHRASACGMPEYMARSMAPESILHVVSEFRIGTPKTDWVFPFGAYCTVDYGKFCNALFRKSGAGFAKAEVHGMKGGKISTSAGEVEADFFADCSGWEMALVGGPRGRKLFSGLEITAPVEGKYEKCLNFFVNKSIVPGYGWIFPVGNGMARVGAGGFCSGPALSKALMGFLGWKGIEFSKNELTGGTICCGGAVEPVRGDVFCIGDSAGHALPLTAEGIKTSLCFSKHAAEAIEAVASGRMNMEEGKRFYAEKVREAGAGYTALGVGQEALLSLPQGALEVLIPALLEAPARERVLKAYADIARID